MERSGFQEIPHTADWALKVWAPDLPGLFEYSARGMYALMETLLAGMDREVRTIQVEGDDNESLLVAFLSELLYAGESEGVGFDRFDVRLSVDHLSCRVWGARIIEQKKEIKAVTFHNLAIRREEDLYIVTIVFDV